MELRVRDARFRAAGHLGFDEVERQRGFATAVVQRIVMVVPRDVEEAIAVDADVDRVVRIGRRPGQRRRLRLPGAAPAEFPLRQHDATIAVVERGELRVAARDNRMLAVDLDVDGVSREPGRDRGQFHTLGGFHGFHIISARCCDGEREDDQPQGRVSHPAQCIIAGASVD